VKDEGRPARGVLGAGYVGLVASAGRAAVVLGSLREHGLDEEASRAFAARSASTSAPSGSHSRLARNRCWYDRAV
jgi:hypothetical protein